VADVLPKRAFPLILSRAKVTGAIYAGVSEQAKAKIADKLTAAGFGA
jgi:hypothetical protein